MATALVAALVLSAGCCGKKESHGVSPAASASAAALSSAEVLSGASPVAPELLSSALNPRRLPVYTGPTGVIEGTVRVVGDPPPAYKGPPLTAACANAAATYGTGFRVGADGAVADAAVMVTGYDGYVPETREAYGVSIQGCAFDKRTMVLTFGQRLEVTNHDKTEVYLPHLNGARNPALMMALAGAEGVKIYAPQPGRYTLTDDYKHPWMEAEVLVLRYATHDVTGANGHYRIEGVPVGQVKVGAMHPAMGYGEGGTVSKPVRVKAGETERVDFELHYPPAGAEAGASAAPRPTIH